MGRDRGGRKGASGLDSSPRVWQSRWGRFSPCVAPTLEIRVDPKTLQHQFGVTHFVVQRNMVGISHEESLVQPQAAGSSVNWVLGHIVRTRNHTLRLLGAEPLYPDDMFSAYGERDTPVGEDEALPVARLLDCFDALQAPLMEGLGAATADALNEPAPFSPTGDPDETIGSLLAGTTFHEAYHAGQLGLLRRVLGMDGALYGP